MRILQAQDLEHNEETIIASYTKRVVVDMTDKEYKNFTHRIKLKEEYDHNIKKHKFQPFVNCSDSEDCMGYPLGCHSGCADYEKEK